VSQTKAPKPLFVKLRPNEEAKTTENANFKFNFPSKEEVEEESKPLNYKPSDNSFRFDFSNK